MRSAQPSVDAAAFERHARIRTVFIDAAIASTPALSALLSVLYRHAPESLAHAHRVAAFAVDIGRTLSVPDHALDDLERAGWTHDLGKFIVRDHECPGLSAMARVCEQLRTGGEILSAVPFLEPAARLVLASRECFDGSGYPLGLTGGEIPLGARVLHVADAYDALISLCVSLGLAAEAVHDELVRHAGSRFDPDVVAACLRCADAVPARVAVGVPC